MARASGSGCSCLVCVCVCVTRSRCLCEGKCVIGLCAPIGRCRWLLVSALGPSGLFGLTEGRARGSSQEAHGPSEPEGGQEKTWPTHPTSHTRKLRPSRGKAFVKKKQHQTTHSQIHGAVRDLGFLPARSGGHLGDAPATGPSKDLRFIPCSGPIAPGC